MSQREVLVDVLPRLNDPEDLGAKKAAKKLVTEVDPVELSLAEQQLIDEGTSRGAAAPMRHPLGSTGEIRSRISGLSSPLAIPCAP